MSGTVQSHYYLPAIAALWPLLVLGACLKWPGDNEQSQITAYYQTQVYFQVQPPTPQPVTSGELTQTGPSGNSRIFWTVPEPGKLELEVTLDEGTPARDDVRPGRGDTESRRPGSGR